MLAESELRERPGLTMPLVYIEANAPWGPVRLHGAVNHTEMFDRVTGPPAHVQDIGDRDPAEVLREALRALPPADAMGFVSATVEKARNSVMEAVSRIPARVVAGMTAEAVYGKPVSHDGAMASGGVEEPEITQTDAGMNANERIGGVIAGSSQSNTGATFGNIGRDRCRARMMTNDDIRTPSRRSGAEVDAKAIRVSLGLSQPAFAKAFGIPLATLRDWEQGRSRPEGAGRTLLTVIEAQPDAVRQAVGGAGSQ